MTLSNKQFENEFDTNNANLQDMIIRVLPDNLIDNPAMFSIAGKVAKHVEHITLNFSHDFPLEKISNNGIMNLLDNIENRL